MQVLLTDGEVVINIHHSNCEFLALFNISQCSTHHMSTFREDKNVGFAGVVDVGGEEAEMRANLLQSVRRDGAAGVEMNLTRS
jgi:hypothetical protein